MSEMARESRDQRRKVRNTVKNKLMLHSYNIAHVHFLNRKTKEEWFPKAYRMILLITGVALSCFSMMRRFRHVA
ncbi:hypothetical protein KIN20_016417 [Parelaphostrongylus tenuis]|uniref:Uncharacterized protein n=1 Tax=Parelaphostrongylus tenuis TaxID=148309 RepID=A0AAD5QT72_PARTN|nr:hypothetical protein KIN20_016417 [Parelaphostrongylus tenuis]